MECGRPGSMACGRLARCRQPCWRVDTPVGVSKPNSGVIHPRGRVISQWFRQLPSGREPGKNGCSTTSNQACL